jgi:hypothetical protein
MQIEDLIEEKNEEATLEEIQDFESQLGIKLPEDIKNFYLKNNGVYFNYRCELFTENELGIHGFSNLKIEKERILQCLNEEDCYDSIVQTYFLEKRILPIVICETEYYEIGVNIDIESNDYGALYILPYEIEKDFRKIANNIDDFLSKLKLSERD